MHAEIVHNDRDEYVLVRHGKVSGSFGPGSSSVLRTGSRLQMGQWCLAFFREEFADHGRPFGGRSGGEFAYQRPQRDPRTGALEHGRVDVHPLVRDRPGRGAGTVGGRAVPTSRASVR